MKSIAIAGSNQLCERLMYYFESTGFGKTVGMFDDFESKGKIKYGQEILGKMEDIPALCGKGLFDAVAIAVGYKHRSFRKQVYEDLKKNQVPLVTFIHPSSHVEKSAVIKEGSIILVDCTIDMDVHLHENVLVSSRCFLSHNVSIGIHTVGLP
ncbi:MAG: hypothetical protein JRJ47_06495 [Deltaproteobacteria bacterium]|nr:hypothetical protein [Deltaproteobacteria bacterium]